MLMQEALPQKVVGLGSLNDAIDFCLHESATARRVDYRYYSR